VLESAGAGTGTSSSWCARSRLAGFDTPPGINPHGFSLHPRSLRHESTKGLTGPKHVSSRVFLAVYDPATGRAEVGANRYGLLDSLTTSTALLSGVSGFNCNHLLTGAYCLVVKWGPELRPASIADALGQGAVAYPIGNPHIFPVDRVEVTYQVKRHLVVAVRSLSPDLLVCLGEQCSRFGAPLAARLAPADATRCFDQGFLGLPRVARIPDRLPICRDEQALQPDIKTRLPSSGGKRLRRHLGAGETDLPASSLLGDGEGFGGAVHRAAPAHRNPAHLGPDEAGVIQPCAVALRLVGESVLAVASLKSWESGLLPTRSAAKECLGGLGAACEHVRQDRAVDTGRVRHLRAAGLQLRFLVLPRDADATARPRRDTLRKCRIITLRKCRILQRATPPQNPRQHPFLIGRRLELVGVGFAPAMRPGYTSRLRRWRAIYSRTARTTSLLIERSFSVANALMVSATWRGKRMVMRVSARAVFMVI